ncbi:MAG: N-acetylmuramoyl-L-alanine amidase [Clostridia bacterium]|nr:N-acetylmuramoyl-L-alanine amidase [Clostridia bacterium]
MKKIIFCVAACLFIFLSTTSTFASEISDDFTKSNVNFRIGEKSVEWERSPLIKNNRILVPAQSFLSNMDAALNWDLESGRLSITKKESLVELTVGEPFIEVNKNKKEMDISPVLVDGTVMVPARFVAEALNYKVNCNLQDNMVALTENNGSVDNGQDTSRGKERKKYIVVIDPGHGGKETGAIYGGVKEKDLNLDIAKRLNKLLKAEGVTTYMTRTGDTYVSLYARSGMANKLNADLLVSVHNNAGMSKLKGSMTLYYPGTGNSKGNLSAKTFASIMQKGLTDGLNMRNMGVIPRPHLAVLRTAKMPAVISEVGYMSNKTELANLKSKNFKQRAAEALKDAVLQSLKRI